MDSRQPRDELIISIVGPAASLVLGGLCLLVARWLTWPNQPIAWGFGYLGAVNILLGVFNMLPGFPLDGGRVLRAIVWRVTGNFRRATRVAGVAGQVVGYGLIAAGLAWLLVDEVGSAIWFAFIGWFLVQAARLSERELGPRPTMQQTEVEGTEEREESEP